MSNSIAHSHIDASITYKGAAYTFTEACDHISHEFEKRDDMAELVLYQTRDIGEGLLMLRSIYKSDKQFGGAIGKTSLGKRSAQDRNDAMFVATNWDKVQKLNSKGELNSLGASAVRKRIKKAESAGNTSKGKAKPDDAKPADVTATSLANATIKLLKEHDITLADFRKALSAAAKA